MTYKLFKELKLDTIETERLIQSQKYLPEETLYILESQSMGIKGPYTSSLHLLTDNYFAEVRLTGAENEFDVIDKSLLLNYRIKIGTQVQAVEQPVDATAVSDDTTPTTNPVIAVPSTRSLVVATVELKHTANFASQLTYFGDDATKWVDFVVSAYPISTLRRA